jgi:hypothetical protein
VCERERERERDRQTDRQRERERENMNLCSCASKVEGSEENIIKMAGIEIFSLVGFYAAQIGS